MTESRTTTYENREQQQLFERQPFEFGVFYDDTKYKWYAAKHRKSSPAELSLVNGLSIECCPHCGGTHFKKSGYYGNGTRRYRCLDCGKAFSPLTGTVFDAHKISISEWIEYMIHLFEFHSLSSSARDNRNAKTYPIVPHQHKWRKNEDGHFTHEKGEKIK